MTSWRRRSAGDFDNIVHQFRPVPADAPGVKPIGTAPPAGPARVGWRTPREDQPLIGVLLPIVLTVGLLLWDVIEGPIPQYVGLVCAMPLLAAALTTPLRTAFVGFVVSSSAFLLGFFQEDAFGVPTETQTPQQLRVAFIVASSLLAVAVSVNRGRKARLVRSLSSVADAAQQAILRPLPSVVGSVRCAATYVSATHAALIGGDLVEVLDTRFGVRILVGDVRGKGMEAVRLAGQVLGSFREHAWTAPDLRYLAGNLDTAVQRDAGLEDFVTAVLVEVHDDGTMLVVSCGHPPPFVTGPGFERLPAEELNVPSSPPLGLLDSLPQMVTTRLVDGQRLVVVTDGLLESRRPKRWYDRRSGEFLPAAEVIGTSLSRGPLTPGLAEVVAQVHRWSRGTLDDDLAVLAVEHIGRRNGTTVPEPLFDIDAWPMQETA